MNAKYGGRMLLIFQKANLSKKRTEESLNGINVMSNTWISQVGSLQLSAKRIERNQRELIWGKLGNQRERASKRTN